MINHQKQLPQPVLYLTVFISGMTSLGTEMAASRLLGNVFGSSNIVWASIIGLILIYLTIGYFVGGKWADRKPDYGVFFQILLWAGFSTLIIPLVSQPVLRLAADAFDQLQIGILAGSFVSVMILLLIPMILLGMASPFAIRLSIKNASDSGQVSGKIYAISTIGSFLGTFLPSLILIPLVGTYRTFILMGLLLIIMAWIGLLWIKGLKKSGIYFLMVIFGLVLLIIGSKGAIKKTSGQIFETESPYNYIQVLEVDGYHLLRLNDGQGVHSIYHPEQNNYYGPWEQFLVGPFFNPNFSVENVKSIGIVGLAAGTTARAATEIFGDIPIDGWEIDPAIVEVGQKYFGMTEPNLNIFVQDGRWGLEKSTRKYSLIAIDAYKPPYIPPHLTTQEFFQIVYEHLDENGVVVINVGRSPGDRRLINDLATTINSIFPSIYVMDLPDTFNSMIFATRSSTQQKNLMDNFLNISQQSGISPLLIDTMQITLANLQPTPSTTRVYTDDLAPIEWVTNNMVLNFLVSDDLNTLKENQ